MATSLSSKSRHEQDRHSAKALGYPTGDVLYVDADNGNDGNDGQSKEHALATLAQAVSLASAGDTIVCAPGGSETLTSTLTVSLANLKIICPVSNSQQGYELTGAGTVDLMTVSGADVHVQGLRFTRTAGAGSTTAGLLTTAAADRLCVENCSFDYTALSSSWTNYGIELTDSITDVLIKGCRFLDCHRGVLAAVATGEAAARIRIEDCVFYVGQSTAFGVYSQPAGTGTLQGVEMVRCHFFEGLGSGAVASDTWDGTDGTNAASGPINFNASVDRWATFDCYAYSARDILFENLHAIAAGSVGEHVDAYTHQRSDVSAVSSDTAVIESQTTVIESNSIVIESDVIVIKSDTAVIESQTTVIESNSIVTESNTIVIESDTTVIESDLALMTPGYPLAILTVIADTDLENNTQDAGDTICTATGGAVLIEEIIIQKDSTALTGPTNLVVSSDNAYGETGASDPIVSNAITALGAQGSVIGSQATIKKLPFALGSGKKLFAHGDDLAGASAGNVRFAVIGRALADGATLA